MNMGLGMGRAGLCAASLLVLLGAACARDVASPSTDAETGTPPAATGETTEAQADACPDDGPRLPVTGLCVGRAVNYFDPARLATSESLPEGCDWVINETPMLMDDEALIYQAARCGEVTTQLEMRAGAGSGALGYVKSAVFADIPEDFEPVRIFTTEGQADPKASIHELAKANVENPAEAAACEIRPFNPADSVVLTDAFVIDVNDAYKAANGIAADEVNVACGPFGVTDSARYWVIRQGYAWFVDFGQDLPDFNPDTLLWLRKGHGRKLGCPALKPGITG